MHYYAICALLVVYTLYVYPIGSPHLNKAACLPAGLQVGHMEDPPPCSYSREVLLIPVGPAHHQMGACRVEEAPFQHLATQPHHQVTIGHSGLGRGRGEVRTKPKSN